MPHNPRRDRSPRASTDPILTDDLIAEALERARAIRCHRGIDRATVQIVPLDSHEAIATTERQWRHRYGIWARRLDSAPPDRWYMVGWLMIDGRPMYRSWAVWLNLEDGRVHLRYERNGQDADDPYR